MALQGRIIIGAGDQEWDGWVATHRGQLDLRARSSFDRYFGRDLAERFLCEHVWEHLSLEESRDAARICFDFLPPGGVLRVAVPDINFPDDEYQRAAQVGGPGPPDHPAAEHQVVYDQALLQAVFDAAGFEVRLLEWWDADGVFHVEPWDVADGPVYRSSQLDHRNEAFRLGAGSTGFTSLILDAIKPTMVVRALDQPTFAEVELLARRMHETLAEVLGEVRASSMFSHDELVERVRWHLDPVPGRRAQVFVAESPAGDIAGHTIVRVDEDENEAGPIGLFATTYVEPAFRRSGTASALLARGETWMRRRLMKTAVTYTDANNTKLLSLYARRDYRIEILDEEWARATKLL